MNDPFFEAAVAEIRGFDLGDDAEILQELQARRAHGDHAWSGDDWLLYAILELRLGHESEALDALEQALDVGTVTARARLLQAYLLAKGGAYEDAEAALDIAQGQLAVSGEDPRMEAAVVHARGAVAKLAGDFESALEHFIASTKLDESIEVGDRWLQIGQLLADLDRPAEARDALDRALHEAPDCDDAMYELAALAAVDAQVEEASSWLERAFSRDATHRRRAIADPRFDEVRTTPRFARLFEPPARPNSAWADAIAPWLETLRNDRTIASLGITWVDRAESDRMRDVLEHEYAQSGPLGTIHTEATVALSRDLLSRRRLVARGPSSKTREGIDEPSLLFVDVADPDRLYLALSPTYPPFLWLEVGTTRTELEQALREFFPRPRRDRSDMPGCARGFIGYRLRFGVPNPVTGELDPADVAELDRHFTLNPFVESASWGSAFYDDPWPDEIPDQPGLMLKLTARQRAVAEQAAGAVWSVTRRTRHSRSYLSIELHHREIFVAQVRYRPSPQRDVIRRVNAHFGCDYPEDLPVDALGALLGFAFDQNRDLEERLEVTSAPEELAGLLLVLSALRHGDLGMVSIYRRYLTHPEPMLRATLCNILVALNYESMLEEMSVTEKDPELRTQIERVLDEGVPYEAFDPYRAAQLEEEYEVDLEGEGGES